MSLENQPLIGTNRKTGWGCGLWLLIAVVFFSIVVVSVLFISTSWIMEQAIFEGSLNITDLRWLIALGYGLTMMVPLGILSLFIKDEKAKAVLRTWWLAGLLAFLLIPSRFVRLNQAQGIALLQIAGMLLFSAGLLVWAFLTRKMTRFQMSRFWFKGTSLAIFFTFAILIPWVLWGALGSPMDIILDLFRGLLAGICLTLIISLSLFPHTQKVGFSYRVGAFLLDGFSVSGVVLILSVGIGQSGNEILLAVITSVIGWAFVFLARLFYKDDQPRNWLSLALLAGLTFALPLLWLDADELMAVISLGTGELLDWSNRMTLVSFGIGMILDIILICLFIYFHNRMGVLKNWVRWLLRGFAILAVVTVVFIYATLGQTGFHGERLFVILRDQADVSTAAKITDYNTRRTYVYRTLVEHADRTQADLRGRLESLGIRYQPYYLMNGLEIQAGPLIRLWLMSQPEVDRVLDDPVLRPLHAPVQPSSGNMSAPQQPQWNLSMIGAPKVWNDFGVTGKGVIIGHSDSGMQGDHPELVDQYRGKGGRDDYNWFDPWYGSSSPVDINGHGTHTLGSILGKSVGVAPGASWIGCVNLGRNLGNTALYLDCMQFMLAPFPQNGNPLHDGKPELGAHVLNNSWGCPWVEGCDANAMLPAVRALRAAGIFVVASAGNSGQSTCSTVKDPIALYSDVYTVGAVAKNNQLAVFSSIGPVTADGSNRTKPDIVAPGQDVLSAYPGSTYSYASGTSMAGPHVVGVVALMWSANPALIGNIERTEEILNVTAAPYVGSLPSCVITSKPNNAVGYGIVDAYAAVKVALEGK
jgi:hypothetical protein